MLDLGLWMIVCVILFNVDYLHGIIAALTDLEPRDCDRQQYLFVAL